MHTSTELIRKNYFIQANYCGHTLNFLPFLASRWAVKLEAQQFSFYWTYHAQNFIAMLFMFKTWKMTKCSFNKIKCARELLASRYYFLSHRDEICSRQLIVKQALPAFTSAWLPPWPVRRVCKSVCISLMLASAKTYDLLIYQRLLLRALSFFVYETFDKEQKFETEVN